MPYLNDLTDKDKEDQQQSGGPQISAGSQVFGAGGNFPSSQSAQANAQKGSGQFADLSEYLRVNQPQGFGTELAGKVGQDVQQAGDTVQNTGQEFKSRVDKSTVKPDDQLVESATGANAADFDSNPDNVKAFQNQMNAKYEGPASFSDAGDLYGQATGAAQTATGKAKAASTEGGRFALLDNYFGRDNYTSGQKSLDNLLVQNDPNAQQAFGQMKKNADQVAANEQQQEKDLSTYGAQGKGQTEAAANNARTTLGVDAAGNLLTDATTGHPNSGAIGNLYQNLQTNAQQAQQKYDTETSDIKNAIASKDLSKLTPDELQMLGLDYRGNLYGADPSQFVDFTPRDNVNINTETSAADASRLKALLSLANQPDTLLDESQAGTAPTDFANFRSDDFNAALQSGQAGYNRILNQNQYLSEGGSYGAGLGNTLSYALGNPSYSQWNPKSGSDANLPVSFPSLSAAQSTLQKAISAVANNGGYSQDYKNSLISTLQTELNRVNGQISGVNNQYLQTLKG